VLGYDHSPPNTVISTSRPAVGSKAKLLFEFNHSKTNPEVDLLVRVGVKDVVEAVEAAPVIDTV
jgi:hypothetical protein